MSDFFRHSLTAVVSDSRVRCRGLVRGGLPCPLPRRDTPPHRRQLALEHLGRMGSSQASRGMPTVPPEWRIHKPAQPTPIGSIQRPRSDPQRECIPLPILTLDRCEARDPNLEGTAAAAASAAARPVRSRVKSAGYPRCRSASLASLRGYWTECRARCPTVVDTGPTAFPKPQVFF